MREAKALGRFLQDDFYGSLKGCWQSEPTADSSIDPIKAVVSRATVPHGARP